MRPRGPGSLRPPADPCNTVALKGKPTTSGFLTRWRATTPSGTDDYASEAAATAIVNIHPITAKKTEKMIPISDFLYFMMLDRQAITVSS